MTIPKKSNSSVNFSNRLNLVLAIIFLLGAAVCGRLFYLQVIQADIYKNRATRQQQVQNTITPTRGQILINNYNSSLQTDTLTALATNKNFAILFAVPKDLDPALASSTANNLYEFFDRATVEKKVDAQLASDDQAESDQELKYIDTLSLAPEVKDQKKSEVLQKHDSLKADPTWANFQEMKRELEINDTKQVILNNYLAKLTKPNDAYEVLQKKVLDENLLGFYAALFNSAELISTSSAANINANASVNTAGANSAPLTAADLEIYNNKIFKKVDLANNPDKARPLTVKGLDYTMTNYRYYPENDLAAQLLGFVNYDNKGNYGLEGYFNKELSGTAGSSKSERGGTDVTTAAGQQYVKPENGADVVLTLDRAVEFYVCQKLAEAQPKYKFDSGTVIVAKPQTGEIIAMCSWPTYNPNNYADVKNLNVFDNPAVSYQFEPGSIFKMITMAAALDQNKVTPETTFKDAGEITISGWPKPIKNSEFAITGGLGMTTMKTVLEKSLNTGAIFAMEKTGAQVFANYVKNFGFGQKTGVELAPEATGNIKNLLKTKIRPIDAATASFGQGLSTTPLQMLMAYAAVANKGLMMKPYLVKAIVNADSTEADTKPQTVRQVISPTAATVLSGMLVDVVENGTAKRAKVDGYYVAGKTGTAQIAGANGAYLTGAYIHTFAGFAPVDKPAFVMLVKLDHPRGFNFAESTATPLFGEIANFLLQYYQIPKSR